MPDAETASTEDTEAVTSMLVEETTGHQPPGAYEDSETEHRCVLILPIPVHTEDESEPNVGGGPTKWTSPRQTVRSCSCCWPKIGPFCRQTIMIVIACSSAFAVATICAYPAVALPRWEDDNFKFSIAQTMLFASTPMVVPVVMSVVAGVVVERLGVRLCLTIGLLVLCLTWVMIAQATHFNVLLLARLIQGLVVSMFLVVMGVYHVEVSQVRWRGIAVSLAEFMVMLGYFLTYLGGLFLHPAPLAYAFVATHASQLILFFFLRESPLWLARRNREDDIVDSLICLRGHGVDIKPELDHIKTSVYTEKIHKTTASKQLLLLRKRMYLKPVILGILILIFKELTGQFATVIYTVKMFRMAGSSLDPYWCAVVMGAARFFPIFLSWVLIDRLPRRLLLSTCMTVAGASLATLGIFLWVWSDSEKGLGLHLGWVPIVCLSVFTLAYGIGIGPTAWTIVAELLPSQVRSVSAGITNACFSLFQFLVGLTFPFFVEAIGVGGVFIAYSLCSLCGTIFVLTCLPETRGRSFTEIQTNFGSTRKHANIS